MEFNSIINVIKFCDIMAFEDINESDQILYILLVFEWNGDIMIKSIDSLFFTKRRVLYE